jgi:glycosyltransferase involved in cell wall biosynthesis
MKIAIIGSRGIPNDYGGFEQFAEILSIGLRKKGHNLTVYNSSAHSYQQSNWKGVKLIHKYDPEKILGTAGQFIYDLNCIRDLRKHEYDIILQLGYTSSSVWSKFLPTKPVVLTNMDGLEWKRSKYSRFTKLFLKYAEGRAVASSDHLVADSIGIQEYLKNKYGSSSSYIPYGAHIFENPNPAILKNYSLVKFQYNLLIARMEPENNIETIIQGHILSKTNQTLVLIGGKQTKYAKYLISKYDDKRILFLGSIYDQFQLNNLRYYSHLYFHGHSVGGTNPSLLEGMASNCLICAHDNIFNRSILQQNAFYFKDANSIEDILNLGLTKQNNTDKLLNNHKKILRDFSWKNIVDSYEQLFEKVVNMI